MTSIRIILPIIVFSQFCCTSLWFASNGVMTDLIATFHLSDDALGDLTSFVQFGFITGTLGFAALTIVDRFSPSRVFLVCALLGALLNLGLLWEGNTIATILGFRFSTGFCLAGIYPVGMKIAADYFDKGLGKSLGFLVGALVVGTAFPHYLKGATGTFSWESVILIISGLSALGGILIAVLVPDGPFRKQSQQPDFRAFVKVFRDRPFRSAAVGYFGHMWELYTFWAFVPLMLETYIFLHPTTVFHVAALSFLIIGSGGIGCVISGYLSYWRGARWTASLAMTLSAFCCLVSPMMFVQDLPWLFAGFLIIWGLSVVSDSPMLSTLVAQRAPAEIRGTALTIVNSIGFLITILSIQLLNVLRHDVDPSFLYLMLAIGPLLGLVSLRKSAAAS